MKFSPEQDDEILDRRLSGETLREIAWDLDVGTEAVRKAAKRAAQRGGPRDPHSPRAEKVKCSHCGQPMPDEPSPTQVLASEWPMLPIAAMIERCWIVRRDRPVEEQTIDDLRESLRAFWRVESDEEIRQILSRALPEG